MCRRNETRSTGFTLAEVMMVSVVIGVLAATALPRYNRYVCKARRAEAFYGLRSIHDAETVYYANALEYTDSFVELGVPVEGGTLLGESSVAGNLYTYTLLTWALGDRENANYRATATGDIDGTDDILDIIIIENQVTIKD